jgi:peptidoglycan/xylan/chitin deacetylase (PgdA/CDA1 family)
MAPTTTVPGATVVLAGAEVPIPGPHPGRPRVISHGPATLNEIALTIDDGTSEETVAGYVDFAYRTGIHLTFCPNGSFGAWSRHSSAIRPLVETGQIQIANHTWSHPDLRGLSDAKVRGEIERNEHWIQTTFGITGRPWFRPPFGYRDARVDSIAGKLGYTNVLIWNGTFGDSGPIPAELLLSLAEQWMKPGTIMLGHANHPTVLGLFDQIQEIMASRDLHPVTLDEMFSTSRREG